MKNELRAAVAKVLITPEEEIGLSGFDPIENVAHPPEDVLDDLYARVLLLDDGTKRCMLISVDCVMVNEEPVRVCDPGGAAGQYRRFAEMFAPGTRQRWAEAAGVEENNVIVHATHTHSAPEHFSEKYVGRITEKLAELSQQLVPVKVSVGVGSSGISAYRRPTLFPNPDVPIDQTLTVMMLETTAGEPLAGFANYAVHPTILHPSQGVQLANRVSSECVGMAMNELEGDFGNGFISLFAQGFSGDVAPVLPGIGAVEDSYGNVRKAGHQLYLDIVQTLQQRQTINGDELQILQQTVSLPTRDGFYTPLMEMTLVGLSIGDIGMLFAPGEIFNGYVGKINPSSAFPYTMLVSLANGYMGYFPTVEAFQDGEGGYEMTTTPYDNRLDGIFTDAARKLLRNLHNEANGSAE